MKKIIVGKNKDRHSELSTIAIDKKFCVSRFLETKLYNQKV